MTDPTIELNNSTRAKSDTRGKRIFSSLEISHSATFRLSNFAIWCRVLGQGLP